MVFNRSRQCFLLNKLTLYIGLWISRLCTYYLISIMLYKGKLNHSNSPIALFFFHEWTTMVADLTTGNLSHDTSIGFIVVMILMKFHMIYDFSLLMLMTPILVTCGELLDLCVFLYDSFWIFFSDFSVSIFCACVFLFSRLMY